MKKSIRKLVKFVLLEQIGCFGWNRGNSTAKEFKDWANAEIPWLDVCLEPSMDGTVIWPYLGDRSRHTMNYVASNLISELTPRIDLSVSANAVMDRIAEITGFDARTQYGNTLFEGVRIGTSNDIFAGMSHDVWQHRRKWFEEIAEREPAFKAHLQNEEKWRERNKRRAELCQAFDKGEWVITNRMIVLVKKGDVKTATKLALKQCF